MQQPLPRWPNNGKEISRFSVLAQEGAGPKIRLSRRCIGK